MTTRTARSAILLAIGSILLPAIGITLTMLWRADLPDPVATHWGPTGADGFTATGLAVWSPALGAAAGLLLGIVLLLATRSTPTMRPVATGFGVGLAGFIAALTTALLGAQRGLTDARSAGEAGWAMALALGVGLLAGFVAALLTPRGGRAPGHRPEPMSADAPRASLPAGAAAAWVGWTRFSAVAYLLVISVVLLLLALAAAGLIGWFVVVPVVIVMAALGALWSFRVTIGRRGVTARSALGWPKLAVPIDSIVEASAGHVRPMRDFGGWGIRVGRRGRYGVVQRQGEALLVRRDDGSTFVVTLDGAHDAAALVNTLVDRHRAGALR